MLLQGEGLGSPTGASRPRVVAICAHQYPGRRGPTISSAPIDDTGEQLLFVYPAGLEQFFLDVHNLDLKMPRDFDELNELSNSKYGINHLPGHDFHAGACTVVAATSTSAK